MSVLCQTYLLGLNNNNLLTYVKVKCPMFTRVFGRTQQERKHVYNKHLHKHFRRVNNVIRNYILAFIRMFWVWIEFFLNVGNRNTCKHLQVLIHLKPNLAGKYCCEEQRSLKVFDCRTTCKSASDHDTHLSLNWVNWQKSNGFNSDYDYILRA